MKSHFYTALWGVLIWIFATVFFIFFGNQVLLGSDTDGFIFRILLLLIITGFLLWRVTKIYLRFDQSKNAPLRFGIIGTIIGLTLDTISISKHHLIFPKLGDSQIIAFTVWMSFAYVLYLLIPAMMNQQRTFVSENKNK